MCPPLIPLITNYPSWWDCSDRLPWLSASLYKGSRNWLPGADEDLEPKRLPSGVQDVFLSPMFPRTGEGRHRKSSSPLTSVEVQDPQNKVGYTHTLNSFFLKVYKWDFSFQFSSLTPLQFSICIHPPSYKRRPQRCHEFTISDLAPAPGCYRWPDKSIWQNVEKRKIKYQSLLCVHSEKDENCILLLNHRDSEVRRWDEV